MGAFGRSPRHTVALSRSKSRIVLGSLGAKPRPRRSSRACEVQVEGATEGLVLVVGPSGAGKSSLLRAGVQAQVDAGALDTDHGEWSTTLIAPGDRPLETLRDALADLPKRPWLLIVDQLEEIFASSMEHQDRFLSELQRIASPDTVVLAGMPADFYERASRVPVLLAALRAEPVLLGPMTEDELRSAIVGPARQAGAQVEDALVERLLADLAPRRCGVSTAGRAAFVCRVLPGSGAKLR